MHIALHIGLSVLWMAIIWVMTRTKPASIALTLASMIGAFITVGLAARPLWIAIAGHYPQDSYWTLSLPGRLGVAAISAVGITVIYLLLASKTRLALRWKPDRITRAAWALFDSAASLLIFGIIFSVSPQVFYTFYLLIFDGLPQQWVIDTVFDAARLRDIAAMRADGSLADHLAGVTLWAILPFTAAHHARHWWQQGR